MKTIEVKLELQVPEGTTGQVIRKAVEAALDAGVPRTWKWSASGVKIFYSGTFNLPKAVTDGSQDGKG